MGHLARIFGENFAAVVGGFCCVFVFLCPMKHTHVILILSLSDLTKLGVHDSTIFSSKKTKRIAELKILHKI